MKNLGMYNDKLSIPRKKDLDDLSTKVNSATLRVTATEEDIVILNSDVAALEKEVNKKLTPPSGTGGQLLGYTANNVLGAVNPTPVLYTSIFEGTLSNTGWVDNPGGGKYQQVSVTGMTSNQLPIIIPKWSSNKQNEIASWSLIESTVESFDGYIRFYSPKATTTSVGFTLIYKK